MKNNDREESVEQTDLYLIMLLIIFLNYRSNNGMPDENAVISILNYIYILLYIYKTAIKYDLSSNFKTVQSQRNYYNDKVHDMREYNSTVNTIAP